MAQVESVARCPRYNILGRHAQWFYLNLLTALDSTGLHDASPQGLKAALFPLKKDIRDADIIRWLAECQSAGLITIHGSDLQRAGSASCNDNAWPTVMVPN